MFCPKCGQWNAGSAAQCTACGTSLLPPGIGDAPAPAPSAPTIPAVLPQSVLPPMPLSAPQTEAQAPLPRSAPPAYPTATPPQAASPYSPPQAPPNYAPSGPTYPSYPNYQQPSYPAYAQQPQSYPNAPISPGGTQPPAYPSATPPAYPSYSPLPAYTPLPTGSPYGGAPAAYSPGYAAQTQRALPQCKVCGHMMAYGIMACAVCTTPIGMIANPFDPTVTTYLDARALNQPGTSPIYAGPGAYSGHAVNAVPEEVRRGWNWAAALNSTLWGFTHRAAGWGLLCAGGLFSWAVAIIAMSSTSSAEMRSDSKDPSNAVVGSIFVGGFLLFWIFKTVYLGAKGNTIAWNSGRYNNVSQMQNAQRQWAPWSILIFCIASAVLFAATFIAANH